MSTKRDTFFSLVPDGSPHEVQGEREVMLPGMSLEILATRKIRLQRWNLRQLIDPYWRLYIPVEGHAVIRHEETDTQLTPGQLYLIPPRTAFSSHNPLPFSKWYVHFILGRSDLLSVPGVYSCPVDDLARHYLDSLASAKGEPYNWESAALVVHALGKLPNRAWTDQKLDPRVTRAMDFLQANLAKRINAEDAAKAAGVSVRNLNHLFRSQLRLAPMTVLLSYRLDRACHLLRHTDQSIEQVAENCGFPNRYYFSRMLKQHRGVSPAAYRKGQLY
ncbi:MAG TPA: AraC family transcriptional regulator [Bacteroidia bacterium]|nr:AraC family transcriptional regulator [Bacteroidia bacterium]